MSAFMAALKLRATRGRNTRVLQHAAGYLKKLLEPSSRAELTEAIEAYRVAHIPILVPITLIRHHAHHHHVDSLKGQVFLEPHPVELLLRNHI